jgi:hypothetical protein
LGGPLALLRILKSLLLTVVRSYFTRPSREKKSSFAISNFFYANTRAEQKKAIQRQHLGHVGVGNNNINNNNNNNNNNNTQKDMRCESERESVQKS